METTSKPETNEVQPAQAVDPATHCSPRSVPDPRIVETLDWLCSAMTRMEKEVSNLLPDSTALATCRICLEQAGNLISEMTEIEAVTTANTDSATTH